MTLFFRHIHFLASRTVYFNSRCSYLFAHADREHMLPLAEDPRAYAECSLLVLLAHHVESLGGEDKASMDEAIKICGLLIDG